MIYQDAELYKYSDNQLSVLRRLRFGFVFQSYNLVRELTGWENILLPVMLNNRRADEAYLNQLIDLLGIRDRLNHLPGAMSGGQQQRVSIARALANKPVILFSDEPTGNLDGKSGREVLVYAPNIVARATGEQGGMHQTNQFFDDEISPAQWDAVLMNDFFSVGQTLPLMQLAGAQADSPTTLMSEDALRSYYGGMERTNLAPVVGGILKGHLGIGGTWFFYPCLITTEKGAAALNLRSNGVEEACVSLASAPDADTEALLARRIERIGNRHGMTFTNALETRRQNHAYQMQIIALFGGGAAVFCGVRVHAGDEHCPTHSGR